jgi:hypothetical protein
MPETGFDQLLTNLKQFLNVAVGDKPQRRKRIEQSAMRNLNFRSYDQYTFLFNLAVKRNYVKRLKRGVYQRTVDGKQLAEHL